MKSPEPPKKVIVTKKNETSPMKKSTKTVESVSTLKSSKLKVVPSKTKKSEDTNVKSNKNSTPRDDVSDNSIEANIKQPNRLNTIDNSSKMDSNKNSDREG